MRRRRPASARVPEPGPARGRRLLGPALAAAVLLASPTPAAAVALSEDQQRQVAEGEVVVLDARPPGASPGAGGGTAVAVVPAPVERVWAVLTDYPGHPRYYPGVVAAEVLETTGLRVLVRYTVRVGLLTFRFHMRKTADPPRRRIEWQLAEERSNGLLRENSGYWLVEARPGGSLVTYAIAVRSYVPAFLTAGSERESLVDTVNGLRRVVAGSGPPGARGPAGATSANK
jgi:ribosome-associated toxin RatA of RatAB toxin-antitoxin module